MLGKNTTLLVDTYNIEEAVKPAVEVAVPNWVACASTPAT